MSNSNLELNKIQKSACLKEMRSAVNGYLYVCSKEGFGVYLDAVKLAGELFDYKTVAFAFNPKHVMHCILSGLKSQNN